MAALHPRYIPRDPSEAQHLTSSIRLLRASDNTPFLASKIPTMVTKDVKLKGSNKFPPKTKLASAILPAAAKPISLLLNHPNTISLVDIIRTSNLAGPSSEAGAYGDVTVWEDMDAGCLAYLLPSPEKYPAFEDEEGWHLLAAQNFHRFSLPESFCWHVLKNISRALLWLHHGVKETEGIPGEWLRHDDDWHAVLIRDVSPAQVWFKKPKAGETYGECKLGGFQWAKVCGSVGATVAMAPRVEEASIEKQYYWAPEIYKHTHSHTRATEVWQLGATVYTMMTGMPPPRFYNFEWQISRMNDKGFGKGLRDIVAHMLEPHPNDRPHTKELVNRVDDTWEGWRATTEEGAHYVDVSDKLAERAAFGTGGAIRLVR